MNLPYVNVLSTYSSVELMRFVVYMYMSFILTLAISNVIDVECIDTDLTGYIIKENSLHSLKPEEHFSILPRNA